MSVAAAFADIALGISAVTGAGFHDALAKWSGAAATQGGSIVTPGTPVEKTCSVQIDSATEAMRQDGDYLDQDMRLLVLAATLDVVLDTSARIVVSAGPYAGTTWMLATCTRDPAGIYFECRGRKA